VFKRALDVRAHTINEEMSSPPAHAIATAIRDDELLPKQIIPSVVNCQVAESVAHAVADAAISGVARRERRTGDHHRSSGPTSRH
jgi:malic enzyme